MLSNKAAEDEARIEIRASFLCTYAVVLLFLSLQ